MGWFSQTVLASVLLIPCWLAIGFFAKNFGVLPTAFLGWFFVGVLGTTIAHAGTSLMLPWGIVASIVAIGAFFGGPANILLFQAIESARIAALPLALGNVNHFGTYACAIILAAMLPTYFPPATFSWTAVAGIACMGVGATLIALSR